MKFFPLLLYFTFLIVCLYTVFKNPQTDLKAWRKENELFAVLLGFGLALLFTGGTYAATIRYLKKTVDETSDDVSAEKAVDVMTAKEDPEVKANENNEKPEAEKKKQWG